jgi:SAM-dependent methyltransferase
MTARRAALLAVAALAAIASLPLDAQDRPRRLFPPEELGVLEGPDRDAWQKPELVMDTLGIGERSAVADVGAGGGWFTVRLARRVGPNAKVYAQDVQQQMLDSISRRVDREGFKNVFYIRGERLDPKLPKAALDAVLMVDTYHEFETPWRCCAEWASRSSRPDASASSTFAATAEAPGLISANG